MPLVTPTQFDSKNVLYGSQKLYLAPYGTPDPVIIPAAPVNGTPQVTLDAAWAPVGFTNAGSTFEYSPTYKNIMVDELMSPVDVIKTAEELKITAALSEATLENMNVAISGATFTDPTAAGSGVAEMAKITVGGSQAYQMYSACFVGTAPSGLPRVVHVPRCFSTAKVSMAFKKDSEIMIPIEFTGLADTSRAIGAQLFQIFEKRANATS